MGGYPHGRVPRPVREAQVVELAEILFLERGYHAASMDELARRAGVSKPVVYDLVGSKEQLFSRLVDKAAADLAEAVVAATAGVADLDAQLRAGGLAFFRFVGEHRAAWTALLSGEGGPANEVLDTIRSRQATLIAGLVSTAHPAAPSAVVDALAHAVNGAYEGLAVWWREHPGTSAEELAELAAALLVPGLTVLGAASS